MRLGGRRKVESRALALFFALFVVFMYGPIFAVVILSFQGVDGGLTFPMNGVSVHWFGKLFEKQMVGDFEASFTRSFILALAVMVLTVVFSLAAGLAFRKPFRGATVVFYLTVASLIVPSILITLGIGLMFDRAGFEPHWYSSGLGAHLTWTLPFGLLIMFAVFNRFDPSYEEAARDLGARPWQVFRYVILPIIGPSLVGVGLFGIHALVRRVRPHPARCRRAQHPAAGDLRDDHQRDHPGALRPGHGDHRSVVPRHHAQPLLHHPAAAPAHEARDGCGRGDDVVASP